MHNPKAAFSHHPILWKLDLEEVDWRIRAAEGLEVPVAVPGYALILKHSTASAVPCIARQLQHIIQASGWYQLPTWADIAAKGSLFSNGHNTSSVSLYCKRVQRTSGT